MRPGLRCASAGLTDDASVLYADMLFVAACKVALSRMRAHRKLSALRNTTKQLEAQMNHVLHDTWPLALHSAL